MSVVVALRPAAAVGVPGLILPLANLLSGKRPPES